MELYTRFDINSFSTRNVNAMLSRPEPTRFIIAMPFTSKFAQQMVDSERKNIDCLDNMLVIGFIALILMSYLHTVMSDKTLYKKMLMTL
jgi:hypothetical protein